MAFMCLGTGNMAIEQTLPELHLLMLERFRTFGLSIVTTTGGRESGTGARRRTTGQDGRATSHRLDRGEV
jgi:hypothetical protein